MPPQPRAPCLSLASSGGPAVGASSHTIRLPLTVRQWPFLPVLPIGTRTALCSGQTPCGAIAVFKGIGVRAAATSAACAASDGAGGGAGSFSGLPHQPPPSILWAGFRILGDLK